MIGVDLIGQIRRAYFEQRRPIKEIVRLLSVSRTTVRKVIRGQETEFKYARTSVTRSLASLLTLGDFDQTSISAVIEKATSTTWKASDFRIGSN